MLGQEVWESILKKYFSTLAFFILLFPMHPHMAAVRENRSLEGPLAPVGPFVCSLVVNFCLWLSHQLSFVAVTSLYHKAHDQQEVCTKLQLTIASHIKVEGMIANGVYSSVSCLLYFNRASSLE